MGCDIHLHIEVKVGGQWHHYGAPYVRRSYKLFAKMADVRNYDDDPIKPISKPKGLPDDLTVLTKLDADHWVGDGHSHSWLGVDEIAKLEEWLTNDEGGFKADRDLEHHILQTYLFGNSFTGWKRYPEDNRHGVEDVRFVFWFDN